jgi:hypothetical protein
MHTMFPFFFCHCSVIYFFFLKGGTSKSSEVLEELTDPEVASNQFMNCISPFVPQLLQEVADSFDIVVDVLDTLIEKVVRSCYQSELNLAFPALTCLSNTHSHFLSIF